MARLFPEVLDATAPYLGKPDEISYQAGKQTLTVKRLENGNSIQIYLQERDNAMESRRVW